MAKFWVKYGVHVKIEADTRDGAIEIAKKTRKDIGFDRPILTSVMDDTLIVNFDSIDNAEEN